MHPHTIYLLLGGNLPERIHWLKEGCRHIAARCGTITRTSQIYETAAWGKEDQEDFLNMAVELRSGLTPDELLRVVNAIEATLGRRRDEKWGSRTLDIDILFYDNLIIDLPNLQIPHPQIAARRFALTPMHELAPQLCHPLSGKTIGQLLQDCTDPLPVKIYQHAG